MNTEFAVADPQRYLVGGLDDVSTPRLLIFEWALLANLGRLKQMSDGFSKLRLMVKTFKSSEILGYYAEQGLRSIKTSGIGEARCMAANTAVGDILISFPCLGPDAERFHRLREEFPNKSFSTIAGNLESARAVAGSQHAPADIFIDIDPGMKRTGVPFGEPLRLLAGQIASLPGVRIRGLHIYDGHIHHSNQAAVARHSESLMRRIDESVQSLSGICEISEVVTGSSLTARSNIRAHTEGGYSWRHTVSPGTSVLWDSGYNDFLPGAYDYAAAVAARVIDVVYSGGSHILTTDCGHKLGIPTDAGPVHVTNFSGYRHFKSNERHGQFCWLGIDRATGCRVETDLRNAVGKVVLVFPRHVCPTVNQYDYALLVREGRIVQEVRIDARDG